jgi:hypothetical protein
MANELPKVGALIAPIPGLPRRFTTLELQQIKELTAFMNKASNVPTWNAIRDVAKTIYPERVISAVDGMRKWLISYNKKDKTCINLGVDVRN